MLDDKNYISIIMILDEKTGTLVPVKYELIKSDTEDNNNGSEFINMHFYETAGLFVEDFDKLTSSQEIHTSGNSYEVEKITGVEIESNWNNIPH